MKKMFSAVAVAVAAALSISACSSEEPPSELDNLINSLQTSQLSPETEPEETEDTEETENTAETTKSDGDSDTVVYNSLTGTVLSTEESLFSFESDGIQYDILISESTEIFGGALSEGQTVTVTYISTEENDNITAVAITILRS